MNQIKDTDIPGLTDGEVDELLASSEYATAALRELTRLAEENRRLKNSLVDIETHYGGYSINNGTSTLGTYIRTVLRSVGDSRGERR